MEPDVAVYFHGNLPHRSGRNTSDRPRWSLICRHNARHNDPFITDARHPNYFPLEIWPNERVNEPFQRVAD